MPHRSTCPRRPGKPAFAAPVALGAAALAFPLAASAADVELVIDLGAGGAMSLRSDTGSAFDIAGYSIFSNTGLLADIGDETLGGQLSPLLFDVDNTGPDEVTMWTLGGGGFNPDLSLPSSPGSLALNLAWTGSGGDDPLTDLIVEYGLSDPSDPLTGVADIVLVTGSITGDYNATGLVEQGDLNQVLNNWGVAFDQVSASWINQRPTEGIVDQAELNAVLNNWGATSSPDFSGSAVPEPGVLAGVILGGLALRRRPVKSS